MTTETRSEQGFGIGATPDLTLRISAANLVKVIFNQPREQRTNLVLERIGTVIVNRDGYNVLVKAKPFGGGLRINSPGILKTEVGEFNFDSHRSQMEGDFRIFINPNNWDSLKQFCWRHLREPGEILETSPQRELEEEFHDALKIGIKPGQYRLNWSRLVVEDEPVGTGNLRSTGSPTARIYSIHEMQVLDADLIAALIESSTSLSNQDLSKEAEKDYQEGGMGWANAALVLDYNRLVRRYQGLFQQGRSQLTHIWGHALDGNVLAILNEVESKKYQHLPADSRQVHPVVNDHDR